MRPKGSKNNILSKQDLSVVIDLNYQKAIEFITNSINFDTVLYSREEMDTIRDMMTIFLKIEEHKKLAKYNREYTPEEVLALTPFQLKELVDTQ